MRARDGRWKGVDSGVSYPEYLILPQRILSGDARGEVFDRGDLMKYGTYNCQKCGRSLRGSRMNWGRCEDVGLECLSPATVRRKGIVPWLSYLAVLVAAYVLLSAAWRWTPISLRSDLEDLRSRLGALESGAGR